jgi:hypothetical protein
LGKFNWWKYIENIKFKLMVLIVLIRIIELIVKNNVNKWEYKINFGTYLEVIAVVIINKCYNRWNN